MIEIPRGEQIEGLEQFLHSLKMRRSGYQHQADEAHSRALEIYKELQAARTKALEELLAQQGLEICNYNFTPGHDQHPERSLEHLGVFPKAQLRLLYSSVEGWKGDDHIEKNPKLERLCQSHFPKQPNKVWTRIHDHNVRTKDDNITSEVVEREGKLFTLVNDIEVNVGVKTYYDDRLYRHFGIRDLPEHPAF